MLPLGLQKTYLLIKNRQVQGRFNELREELNKKPWDNARSSWLNNRDKLFSQIIKADQEGRIEDKRNLVRILQNLDTAERKAAGEYFDEYCS